jgi:hypothetical protein
MLIRFCGPALFADHRLIIASVHDVTVHADCVVMIQGRKQTILITACVLFFVSSLTVYHSLQVTEHAAWLLMKWCVARP